MKMCLFVIKHIFIPNFHCCNETTKKKKIATCKKILKVLKMVNYISLEHKRNTNIAVYMYTGISQN